MNTGQANINVASTCVHRFDLRKDHVDLRKARVEHLWNFVSTEVSVVAVIPRLFFLRLGVAHEKNGSHLPRILGRCLVERPI